MDLSSQHVSGNNVYANEEANMNERSLKSTSNRSSLHSSNYSNEEFHARPIMLSKRHNSKTDDNKKKPNDENEDFTFRPMRLTSRTKVKESDMAKDSLSPDRKRSIEIKCLPIDREKEKEKLKDSEKEDMIFAVCLVDFHHVRGPEIQWWKSSYVKEYPNDGSLFKNLAFQALPDGAHLFEETYSNFNLVYDFTTGKSLDNASDYDSLEDDPRNLTTLFGCSCIRQIKTDDLKEEERKRNKEFTRSIIQKAVIVISRNQPIFQIIKEKISIITASFFMESDFSNTEVLESLFDNLNSTFKLENTPESETSNSKATTGNSFFRRQDEFFVNLNLREILIKFGQKLLIILKALILEKRVMIYSNNNLEFLTQFQNSLISLIPNLVNNLNNSGCPLSDILENHGPASKPTSLNTTSRQSMLRFFGLPLQLFNTKGSFWNPYLPLQQLDELKLSNTSFMIGCSNLLFVNQSEELNIDILINLDDYELSFPNGYSEELHLSNSDKMFMSMMIQNIQIDGEESRTIHESEGYVGSDDYIRYMFEDYILSLLSSTRYDQYMKMFHQPPPGFSNNDIGKVSKLHQTGNEEIENIVEHFEDEVVVNASENGKLSLFNTKFIEEWTKTKNFHVWNLMADDFIFNFVSPKHISVRHKNDSQTYKLSTFINSFKTKLRNVQSRNSTVIKSDAQKYFPSNDSSTSNLEGSISNDNENKRGQSNESEASSTFTKSISNWANSWKSRRNQPS